MRLTTVALIGLSLGLTGSLGLLRHERAQRQAAEAEIVRLTAVLRTADERLGILQMSAEACEQAMAEARQDAEARRRILSAAVPVQAAPTGGIDAATRQRVAERLNRPL